MFGPGYSGLEYDYRGLLRLYHQTGNDQEAIRYGIILQDWNQLRVDSNELDSKPLEFITEPRETGDVITDFFSLAGTSVTS